MTFVDIRMKILCMHCEIVDGQVKFGLTLFGQDNGMTFFDPSVLENGSRLILIPLGNPKVVWWNGDIFSVKLFIPYGIGGMK